MMEIKTALDLRVLTSSETMVPSTWKLTESKRLVPGMLIKDGAQLKYVVSIDPEVVTVTMDPALIERVMLAVIAKQRPTIRKRRVYNKFNEEERESIEYEHVQAHSTLEYTGYNAEDCVKFCTTLEENGGALYEASGTGILKKRVRVEPGSLIASMPTGFRVYGPGTGDWVPIRKFATALFDEEE